MSSLRERAVEYLAAIENRERERQRWIARGRPDTDLAMGAASRRGSRAYLSLYARVQSLAGRSGLYSALARLIISGKLTEADLSGEEAPRPVSATVSIAHDGTGAIE